MSNERKVLERMYEEAKAASLPVFLDTQNERLVFETSDEEFADIFHFMDKRKIQTKSGLAYPISFAVFGTKKTAKYRPMYTE